MNQINYCYASNSQLVIKMYICLFTPSVAKCVVTILISLRGRWRSQSRRISQQSSDLVGVIRPTFTWPSGTCQQTDSCSFSIFYPPVPGRRYARWHLWQDKLVYILVFFVFIVWLEWTIHSQVFPLEVSRQLQRPVKTSWCRTGGDSHNNSSSSRCSLKSEEDVGRGSLCPVELPRGVRREWRPAARLEDGVPTLLTTVCVTSVSTTSGRKVSTPHLSPSLTPLFQLRSCCPRICPLTTIIVISLCTDIRTS